MMGKGLIGERSIEAYLQKTLVFSLTEKSKVKAIKNASKVRKKSVAIFFVSSARLFN